MRRVIFVLGIATLGGCAHPPAPVGAPLARAKFYARREAEKPAETKRYETIVLRTSEGDVAIHLPRLP